MKRYPAMIIGSGQWQDKNQVGRNDDQGLLVDTIRTGRLPACSCPRVGFRLAAQISPREESRDIYQSSNPSANVASH